MVINIKNIHKPSPDTNTTVMMTTMVEVHMISSLITFRTTIIKPISSEDTNNRPPFHTKKAMTIETTKLIPVQTTMNLTVKEFILIHIFNCKYQNYEKLNRDEGYFLETSPKFCFISHISNITNTFILLHYFLLNWIHLQVSHCLLPGHHLHHSPLVRFPLVHFPLLSQQFYHQNT